MHRGDDVIHITVNMGEALAHVGGGGGRGGGILEMVPYTGIGSSVSTKAFYTSVKIPKKAQKNLGKSTHPIGIVDYMQIGRASCSPQ